MKPLQKPTTSSHDATNIPIKKKTLKQTQKKPATNIPIKKKTLEKNTPEQKTLIKKSDDLAYEGQLHPFRLGTDFSGLETVTLACQYAGLAPKLIFASEKEEHLQRLIKLMHGPKVIMYPDIKDRDSTQAPRVDLLVGGPPCQPYSTAGLQQGIQDQPFCGSNMSDMILNRSGHCSLKVIHEYAVQ